MLMPVIVSKSRRSSGGSALPPGYSAWLAAASAVANPTATDKSAVQTLLTSMNNGGFPITDFDYIYLMIGTSGSDTATQRYNQKKINIVNPGTFDATITLPNASGHVAGGTAGNKLMYWNTGYNSSTRLVDRTNNASMGHVVTTLAPTDITIDQGWDNGASNLGFVISRYNASLALWAYGAGSGATAVPTAAPVMPWVNMLANTQTGYANTTSKNTDTPLFKSIGAVSNWIFSSDTAGVPDRTTDATLAFAWHGRAMASGAENTAWYTIVQTLMATYGVTI